MKKAHIGGVYYGLHNIGDEAIAYSMIKEFGQFLDISISTYNSSWIKESFPSVKTAPILVTYEKPKLGLYRMPRKQVINNFLKDKKQCSIYKNSDLYICGGATILSDCPWYSLRTVQKAHNKGINSILWGVGLAEINDKDTRQYLVDILNEKYVLAIYTRDEYVKDRLEELGVNSDKVKISYDPAIMIEGDSVPLKEYLNEDEIGTYQNQTPNICVSISGEEDVVGRTNTEEITSFVRALSEKYNVFFIPTGCGEHCKDRAILKRISETVNKNNVIYIDKEFTPNQLVSFLKNCRFSISSRLHLNIFSACAGIPSVGLVRNSKIIDFANLMHTPYIQLDQLTAKSVIETVSTLETDYGTKVNYILNEVSNMRKAQAAAVNEVKTLVYQ